MKITLAAARVNAGLTQAETASRLNVRKETVMNWEKGRTFPNAEKIGALCELYHVSYDDIDFTRHK